MRLRSTAFPITLPTVSPTRGLSGSATRKGLPSFPHSGRTEKKKLICFANCFRLDPYTRW